MADNSRELRATSEMKLHDDVTIDQIKQIVADLAVATEAEPGGHNYGHNFYLDEGARILFAHEHYRDAAGMLTHLAEMDQPKVAALMDNVDVLDLRIYGETNEELEQLLGSFGAPRIFSRIAGFTRVEA